MRRKLILYMSMSLDGFAAGPDGVIDWLGHSRVHDDRRQRGVLELLGQAGTIVLGRRGGEQMAQAWPSSTSPTGALMNSLPKVVFSRTVTEIAWSNARVSDQPIEQGIAELKDEPGKDIVVFGGASFARSLAAQGLIDEYRINIQPVSLGAGLPLLPEAHPLELVSSTVWTDGVVSNTYSRR
jgi:dihydrofolate reductase